MVLQRQGEPIRQTPPAASPGPAPPAAGLLDTAIAAAEADNHVAARLLFVRAYEQLQLAMAHGTEERDNYLRTLAAGRALPAPPQGRFGGVEDSGFMRWLSYIATERLIGQIRTIVAYYPHLTQRALAAGNSRLAARYEALERLLRAELVAHTGRAVGPIVLEATTTHTDRGPGWVIQGADNQNEVAHELPGVHPPEDLGRHAAFRVAPADLMTVLTGQEALATDLIRFPDVVRELGGRPLDLNDRAQRLRVWRAAYEAMARADPGSAFENIVRLLERHLQAYSMHSQFNIRDTGQNYATSRFPSDVLGRAVRDCGVYALAVAQELHELSDSVRPPLALRFRLHTTVDHVFLTVFDDGSGTHFIFSNNTAHGPFTGPEPLEHLTSRITDPTRGSSQDQPGTDFVALVASIDIGSTGTRRRRFDDQAWRAYQRIRRWGFVPVPPTGEHAGLPTPRRLEIAARRYYEAMREYNRISQDLRVGMSALEANWGRRGELMPGVEQAATELLQIIRHYHTHPGGRIGARTPAERTFIQQHLRGVEVQAETIAGDRTTGTLYRLAALLRRADPAHPLLRQLNEVLYASDRPEQDDHHAVQRQHLASAPGDA